MASGPVSSPSAMTVSELSRLPALRQLVLHAVAAHFGDWAN